MQHVREFIPKDNELILIVVPHPDDEVLGCGGLLAKYHKQIDILLITDGEIDDDPIRLGEKNRIRLGEFENVIRTVGGVNNITMLHLPVYSIKNNYGTISKYNIRKYSYIFVPHRNEHHADHRCLYSIIKKMLFWQGGKAELIEYESTTALQLLYYYLDLNDPVILSQKKKMMIQYKSQMKGFDYEGIHMGLSRYQGALVHKKYVEAYYKVPSFYLLKRIYVKMPEIVKNYIERIYKTT